MARVSAVSRMTGLDMKFRMNMVASRAERSDWTVST
jgi:hypothetical protein